MREAASAAPWRIGTGPPETEAGPCGLPHPNPLPKGEREPAPSLCHLLLTRSVGAASLAHAASERSRRHPRSRRGISAPLHAVSTSVVAISSSAIAEANGQLLFVLNSQYSSGAIIWNRGPPSRYGVA